MSTSAVKMHNSAQLKANSKTVSYNKQTWM